MITHIKTSQISKRNIKNIKNIKNVKNIKTHQKISGLLACEEQFVVEANDWMCGGSGGDEDNDAGNCGEHGALHVVARASVNHLFRL